MHHTLFFSFLTHPQHCEQWVGAEHADPMLRDMLLQGAGAASVLVSTYSSSLAATLAKAGYTDSPSTFSLVSGLWTSAFALGNFLGPTVAGALYDQIGFQWGTVCVQVVLGSVIALNVWTWNSETRRRRIHQDKLYEELSQSEIVC